LNRLSVKPITNDVPTDHEALCWAQAIPVIPDLETLPKTVLLELDDVKRLPQLSVDLKRFGSDIIGWRIRPDERRVIVQVNYPSLFTIARPTPPGVTAFAEHSPSVWVESGYRHPIAAPMSPAKGQFTLIRKDNSWELIVDLSVQANGATFNLPAIQSPQCSDNARSTLKIRVEPRLVRDRSPSMPTLWTMPGDFPEPLRIWLNQVDDGLVRQLHVARINSNNGPMTVLRFQSGRDLAPPLMPGAVAHQSYLRIPNLFLPVAYKLQPPMRRDWLRELYAPMADRLYWLDATNSKDLAVKSAPINAFRPLIECINYQSPLCHAYRAMTSKPLFQLDSIIAADRPALKLRRKPAPTVPIEPATASQGWVGSFISWVKGAWRVVHKHSETDNSGAIRLMDADRPKEAGGHNS